MGNCQQCNDSLPNKPPEIQTTKKTKNKQNIGQKLNQQEMKGVIKIQANFRGYIIRKKFNFKFSRSTTQKHSSSILSQKSSHNDMIIEEISQVKQNTLQIQETLKRLPPKKIKSKRSMKHNFAMQILLQIQIRKSKMMLVLFQKLADLQAILQQYLQK